MIQAGIGALRAARYDLGRGDADDEAEEQGRPDLHSYVCWFMSWSQGNPLILNYIICGFTNIVGIAMS